MVDPAVEKLKPVLVDIKNESLFSLYRDRVDFDAIF